MQKAKRILGILLIFMISIFIISCGKATQNSSSSTVENQQLKKIGWIQENGNWYYYNNDGKPQTGWVKDNDNSYYLDSSGVMQTGWIKDKGKDYYCYGSGAMQTGWKESNGRWYYLNSDGSMVSNQFVDGYYLTFSGAMEEKDTTSSSKNSSTSDGTYNSNIISNKREKIAYIPSTGPKKYHRIPDCGNMNPRRATKTTVAEAEREGYGRCRLCW